MGACSVLYRIVRDGCRHRLLFRPGAEDGRYTGHRSGWARGRNRGCNLHGERGRVAAGHRSGDGATRWASAFPAVVAMVDRAVRIDRVLLAASGVATGPDAESRGARDAGRHGFAHCVLPILPLVVLSRVACIHRSARRLLSYGGEAHDMIDEILSLSIAPYRQQNFSTVDLTVKFKRRRAIAIRFRYLAALKTIEWE